MGQRIRIAVVDGEPLIRRTIATILETAGYAVEATDDINVLVNRCKEDPPDLVLTNVFLPGITGHDAMCLLKERCPSIPVLMVSGLPAEPTIQKWLDEDGFDVFPKPFTSKTLVEKVQQMLAVAHS